VNLNTPNGLKSAKHAKALVGNRTPIWLLQWHVVIEKEKGILHMSNQNNTQVMNENKKNTELIKFDLLAEIVRYKQTNDWDKLCEAVDKYESELLKMPFSGSLKDVLFNLANEFAVANQGDVAVTLHIIHNQLP
jgi:hypothetical protein